MVQKTIVLQVNGQKRETQAEGNTPLLYVLRNDLELKGARFGCGQGDCGSCTVIMDGKAVQSCDIPLEFAVGRDIETVEGLGPNHPLVLAMIEEQAGQCGYCMSGIIMAAKVLLSENPSPSREEIGQRLNCNLCRCGSHPRIFRAIARAGKMLAGEAA